MWATLLMKSSHSRRHRSEQRTMVANPATGTPCTEDSCACEMLGPLVKTRCSQHLQGNRANGQSLACHSHAGEDGWRLMFFPAMARTSWHRCRPESRQGGKPFVCLSQGRGVLMAMGVPWEPRGGDPAGTFALSFKALRVRLTVWRSARNC